MTMTQSFLPIIKEDYKSVGGLDKMKAGSYDLAKVIQGTFSGRILGLYAITTTVFDGAETTFDLTEGAIAIKQCTPRRSLQRPLIDFMAAVPTRKQISDESYKGYSGYIPISKVMPSYRYTMAAGFNELTFTPGALIYGLQNSMAAVVSVGLPAAPTVSTPAALTWEATAPFVNAPPLQFFDFNWVTLFALSKPTLEPAFIQITGQPAGGALIASVMSSAQPVMNYITYDTVRITRVPNTTLAAGVYAFTFSIVDRLGNTAVATTLNLTVL